MKTPKVIRLPSGEYFTRLRLNGVSIPITRSTEKECRDEADLIKSEWKAGKRQISKNNLTLKEACTQYIAKKEKAGRSPETIRGYDIIARNRFQSAMDK